MRRITLLFTAFMLLASAASSFAATVPQAASAMGRELDRQVVSRLRQPDSPAQGVTLFVTTPVNINNLEEANPLARQMEEELARWFAQSGYHVQEIRKGADVLFQPPTGELLLTRRADLLGADGASSAVVLTGTYVVTSKNVRFNIRLVQTNTQDVLAMSTMTVPIGGEVASLIGAGGAGGSGVGAPIEPTVVTRLP